MERVRGVRSLICYIIIFQSIERNMKPASDCSERPTSSPSILLSGRFRSQYSVCLPTSARLDSLIFVSQRLEDTVDTSAPMSDS
jgi:hypothetical protein